MPVFVFMVLFGLVVAAGGGLRGAPLSVVATTGMVGDLVGAVGGGRVEVRSLMGPGIDPHLYKPTASDASQLARADVIFYSGLGLEGRMGGLFERIAARGGRVVAVGESLPAERLLVSEDHGGLPDPHVWFDADLWAGAVPAVVEGLTSADPEGEAIYSEAGRALMDRLRELDAWCREVAAEIPEGRRILVTSHDAFNYFGRAYGFRVVALQGVSTTSEAGLADVAGMVDFLREEGVPAIFVETSVNPRGMARVAGDAGVEVGGELFSDAMGSSGEMKLGFDTGTYEGMMKYNMRTIVDALGGQSDPPESGS
jgi:manganese/zinc/iron transport system substrate-binding protein